MRAKKNQFHWLLFPAFTKGLCVILCKETDTHDRWRDPLMMGDWWGISMYVCVQHCAPASVPPFPSRIIINECTRPPREWFQLSHLQGCHYAVSLCPISPLLFSRTRLDDWAELHYTSEHFELQSSSHSSATMKLAISHFCSYYHWTVPNAIMRRTGAGSSYSLTLTSCCINFIVSVQGDGSQAY